MAIDSPVQSEDPSGRFFASSPQDRLAALILEVQGQLTNRAASDRSGFHDLLSAVFGATGGDPERFSQATSELLNLLASGDGLGLRFEIETAAGMAGVCAAYAAIGANGVPTVYVNADKLEAASDSGVRMWLLEEIGHHFDNLLNGGIDSPGDEGELFANLFNGNALSPQERTAISTENDSIVLTVDGRQVMAEAAASNVVITGFTDNVQSSTGTFNTSNTLTNDDTPSINITYSTNTANANRYFHLWVDNGSSIQKIRSILTTQVNFASNVTITPTSALPSGIAAFWTTIDNTANPVTPAFIPSVGVFDIRIDAIAPAAPTFSLASDTGSSNSDGITNNGLVYVSGIEAGASWQYSTNSGNSWTTGSGTSFTLGAGIYAAGVIRVRQTDAAGNTTTTPSQNAGVITIDRVASSPSFALASDTGSSNSDGITNNGLVNVSGIEAGASWHYSTNSGSGWTAGSGTSFTLAAGSYAAGVIRVRQTDLAGNTTTPSQNAGAITVDAVAPAAPSFALANDTGSSNSDGITSNGLVNVSGIEAGASWQYSTDGGNTWTAGSGTSFTLAAGSYAAGVIRVRQTDVAGNTTITPSQNEGAITIDIVAPNPTFALASDTGSSNSDGITSNGLVNVSGIESGASWEYSTDSGSSWTAGSGTTFTLAAGSYSAGVIRLRQTDLAGNTTRVPTEIIPAYTTTDTLGTPTSSGGYTSSNVASSYGFFFDTSSDVLIDALGFSAQSVWLRGSSSYTVSLWSYSNGGASLSDFGTSPLASAVFTPGNTYTRKEGYYWQAITPISLSDSASDDADELRGYVIAVIGDFSSATGNVRYESANSAFNSRFIIDGNGYNDATDPANYYPIPIFDGGINSSGYFNANLSYTPEAVTIDDVAPAAPTFALASDTGSSNSDGITSNGLVNVSGIEAGASWEYSTNSGSSWTAGSGTSFTLAAGSYDAGVIRVRQTDLAGNTTTTPSQNAGAITVDAVAPAAPSFALANDTGSSNSDGITNNGLVNVSGIEAGASWQYSTDGGTSWTTGSGTSFTLAAGSYAAGVIRVRQTDAAGNTTITPSQNGGAITVDSDAPAAPTFALANDTGSSNSDGITTNGLVTVSGIEAGASWQYSINGGSSWTTGSGTSFTLAAGSYAAGVIRVRQTDVAGNTTITPSQNAGEITIDTVAPAAPTFALANDAGSSNSDGITNDGLVMVSGIEAGASWQYSINGGSSWTTGSGTSFTLAAGSYAAGVIRVRQTDAAGNTTITPSQNAGVITIDVTPPTAAVAISFITTDTGVNGDDITSDTTLTVTGTNGTLGAAETVQISADGTTWANVSQSSGIWSFIDPTIRTSNFTYQVRVVDVAGNTGNTASQFVTIDTQAPATVAEVTNVKNPDGTSIGNNQTTSSSTQLTIEGSLTAPLIAGESILVYDGVTRLGLATVSGSGWTFTDNRNLSANQVVQYIARVSDIAANQSAAGSPYTIKVSIQSNPVISVGNISFVEGNTGTSVVNLLVSLSSSSTQAVTVNYAFRLGTGSGFANSADFSVASSTGTLTFSPGTLSRTIPFTVNGDTVVEPDEVLFLDLTNPSANSSLSGNVATLTATATIRNDDTNPNQGVTIISDGNFSGSPLDDTLTGGNLVNQIQGLAGNDTITGLGGADVLSGGSGADLFRYPSFSDSTINSTDQLTDFSSTQGDLIGVATLPTKFWNVGNLGSSTTITLANAMQSAFNDKNIITAGNQPLASGEAVTFSWSDGQRRYNYVAIADGNTGSLSGDLFVRLPSTSFPANLAVGDISSFTLFRVM